MAIEYAPGVALSAIVAAIGYLAAPMSAASCRSRTW
jgi:hypothetical protein